MAENLGVITPEVFKHGMNNLLMCCKEPSISNACLFHSIYKGTRLMCATLRQLGYTEGIDTFEELCMTPKPEKSGSFSTFLN